jgi:hypothetical protein
MTPAGALESVADLRAWLEARVRVLQGEQQQHAAHANAAAGALELCQQLLQAIPAAPLAAPREGAP